MTDDDRPRFGMVWTEDAGTFAAHLNDPKIDGYNLIAVISSSRTHYLAVFEREDVVLAREVRRALAVDSAIKDANVYRAVATIDDEIGAKA